MKKLLALLGAISLIATTSSSVVACGNDAHKNDNDLGDEFDINQAILTLKQIATSVLNDYFLSIKSNLTHNIDSADNFSFFNVKTLKQVLGKQDENQHGGVFTVELDKKQTANLQIDLNKIFKAKEIQDKLNSTVKDANLEPLISRLNGGNIFDSLEFLPLKGNATYTLSITRGSGVGNVQEIAAYQFQFNFDLVYKYIDANGLTQKAKTDKLMATFNLIGNSQLKKYIDWSSVVLPAQMFNYSSTNAANSDSALHISEKSLTDYTGKNGDEIFATFSGDISKYAISNLGVSLEESLTKVLKNPADFGGDNIISINVDLDKDQKFKVSNFAINYQFGANIEYNKIKNVNGRTKGEVAANQNIYSAIYSDWDALIDSSGKVNKQGSSIFALASKEYIEHNKSTVDKSSKHYHVFDTSKFQEDFDDFGIRFTSSTKPKSSVKFATSLNKKTEQQNTYAFGNLDIKDIQVHIHGFIGHFSLDLTLPWIYTPSKVRTETFTLFFISYAKLRRLLNIKFFEDITGIDKKRHKAFMTMKVRSDKEIANGGYDVMNSYSGKNNVSIGTGILIYTMNSGGGSGTNSAKSGFANWFKNNKNSLSMSSINEFGFRDNGSNYIYGDAKLVRTANNKKVGIKAGIDYAKAYGKYKNRSSIFKVKTGIGLNLITSFGRIRVGFDTINKNADGTGGTFPGLFTVYRANGKKVEIKDPFAYINDHILMDASYIIK